MFVRKDLPAPQRTVQAAHACIESAKAFLPDHFDHPHLVVLGVNDESKLRKCAVKLDRLGISYKLFIEPDRDHEATALATCPVSGDAREHFKNYTLLGAE